MSDHAPHRQARSGPVRARLVASLLAALAFLLVACGTTGPVIPDPFELDVVPESVDLAPGSSTTVAIELDRSADFDGAVTVTVDDLPSGVAAAPLTIGVGATTADLFLTADDDADPVQDVEVEVVGTGGGTVDEDTFRLTITGDGDLVDDEVTAVQGSEALFEDEQALDSFTLQPGEERVYRVITPDSQEAALYVYLDEPLDLSLYSGSVGPGGTPFATSSSSAFFAAGAGGLALTDDAALAPQVVVQRTCPGSCIIAENPGAGNVYVRVANPTGSTVSFTLWAVLSEFDDSNEANASFEDPQALIDSVEGAIETIDDEDYFIVDVTPAANEVLYFDFFDDAGTGLQLVAEIIPFGSETPDETIVPGEFAEVDFSDTVVVYAQNDRAAVSGNSAYTLTLDEAPATTD